jgi:hypothetical protein
MLGGGSLFFLAPKIFFMSPAGGRAGLLGSLYIGFGWDAIPDPID